MDRGSKFERVTSKNFDVIHPHFPENMTINGCPLLHFTLKHRNLDNALRWYHLGSNDSCFCQY